MSHIAKFFKFVFIRILDNAKRVDPEIFTAQFVGYEDRIRNCLWERDIDPFANIGVNVGSSGFLILLSAPHVAEGTIVTFDLAVCFE